MKKTILITLVILIAITSGGYFFLTGGNDEEPGFFSTIATQQSDMTTEKFFHASLDKEAVDLLTEGDGKNVLNFYSENPYKVATSDAANARLERLIKKTEATLEQPIVAANPFGTNLNSLYFYFESEYEGIVKYTITVEDANIPDHVRYVNNGEESHLSQVHEFTVSGFVPGKVNYLHIEILNENGNVSEEKSFEYNVPAYTAQSVITKETGNSRQNPENGMYFCFFEKDNNILTYDNSGVLRNITVTEGNHGKRIYVSGDSILYQIAKNRVAKVSSLGRVTGVATFAGYDSIRDFSYDGYGNVYAIAKKGKKYHLAAASLTEGTSKVVYKFPKKLELVSLSSAEGGDVYISASKPNGLIHLTGITSKDPTMDAVYGKQADWKNVISKKKIKWNKETKTWKFGESLLHGNEDEMAVFFTGKAQIVAAKFKVNAKKKELQISQDREWQESMDEGSMIGNNLIFVSKAKGEYVEYDTDTRKIQKFVAGSPLQAVEKLTLNDVCFFAG